MSAVSLVQADTFEWLTFTLADGSEVAVAAENLLINYGDGVLNLSSPSVNTSFEIANLRSMRFTSDASGIFITESGLAGIAEYFTVAGVSAGFFESADDARSTLPGGVYIVRRDNKSWKVLF